MDGLHCRSYANCQFVMIDYEYLSLRRRSTSVQDRRTSRTVRCFSSIFVIRAKSQFSLLAERRRAFTPFCSSSKYPPCFEGCDDGYVCAIGKRESFLDLGWVHCGCCV